MVLSLACYDAGMAITYAAAGVAAGISTPLLGGAAKRLGAGQLRASGLRGVVAVDVRLLRLQLPTALQSQLSNTASHRKRQLTRWRSHMGVLGTHRRPA